MPYRLLIEHAIILQLFVLDAIVLLVLPMEKHRGMETLAAYGHVPRI